MVCIEKNADNSNNGFAWTENFWYFFFRGDKEFLIFRSDEMACGILFLQFVLVPWKKKYAPYSSDERRVT